MLAGEGEELVHVGLDGLDAALHRRDGVALALEADAAAEDGAEMLERGPCGAATVHPRKVAPENEDFVGLQFCNVIRSKGRTLRSIVNSFVHSVTKVVISADFSYIWLPGNLQQEMNALGNIFWLILGGLIVAIIYYIVGLLMCVTIVGIPFGVQHFKMALSSIFPFGRVIS